MRLRSFFGLLLAVGAAFVAAYHVRLNGALLDQRFRLGEELSIPLWGAILGAFLAGFLPVAAVLVVDTLRHELALRAFAPALFPRSEWWTFRRFQSRGNRENH